MSHYTWLDDFKGVKYDFTPNPPYYGFWAFLDNEGMLVIGEERGRDGGQLYRGPWKGKETPYLFEIKKEQPKLYSKIVDYCEKESKNFQKKMTKTVYVSYSVLKTFEVPEDWNDREITDYLEGMAPEEYNDMEYVVKED